MNLKQLDMQDTTIPMQSILRNFESNNPINKQQSESQNFGCQGINYLIVRLEEQQQSDVQLSERQVPNWAVGIPVNRYILTGILTKIASYPLKKTVEMC